MDKYLLLMVAVAIAKKIHHKGTENTEVRGQIFSESLSFLCAFAALREKDRKERKTGPRMDTNDANGPEEERPTAD
jgi:hypothetical protein